MISPLKSGLARGLIELRQTLTTPIDLWGHLFPGIALAVTVFFMRDAHVPGTNFSLGAQTLPGALGMGLAFSGLVLTAQLLVIEREDGTLLRAKTTPGGMTGYLIGKIVTIGGAGLFGFLVPLIPALFLVDGLQVDLVSWLTLLWLLPLAFVATMPLGAVLGSLFDNARSFGLIMLPIFGVIAISGIFYPITALPGWLQTIGQIFPIYWLGLGVRSAFLPDAFTVAELGDSWRHLETFGVLGAWAVLGLVLAPRFLRRMARRESGSAVAARRERMLTSTIR